jgi:hypothetical protein
MAENKKKQPNWPLLLPIGLLLVDIIVIVVMRIAGYGISQYLFFFFILLGIFLLYQIGKQLIALWRVQSAIGKLGDAQKLAESGQPMEAVKLWKKLLLSLPRDKYLEVLSLIEDTYKHENMSKAVQQVKAVYSESIEFFKMTKNVEQITAKDRRDWQARAYELRNMISVLPEEKV